MDECIEGTIKLLRSNFTGPVNIGSDEMVTINQLVDIISAIAGKKVVKNHINGPTGVMGRNSDNELIYKKLKWKPTQNLTNGLEKTYSWIESQINET
jgi:nucleoside-diphosphate-sugar epimerase